MQFNPERKRCRQRGMTLIEATMVLALSAVVIAGVMLYFQSAQANNRLQSAMGELGGIQTAVQTIYASQSNYTDLTTSKIMNSGSIPPVFRTATGLTNPWKGNVDVAVDGRNNKMYKVTFENIPREACVAMASMDLGGALQGVVLSGSVGGLAPVRPSPAAAASGCSSDANVVIWVFK